MKSLVILAFQVDQTWGQGQKPGNSNLNTGVVGGGRSYAADVKLASLAIDSGSTQRGIELLTSQIPRNGNQNMREFSWHYLWHLLHAELATLKGHEGEVYSVDYSPADSLLASCGQDRTVRLWDLASHSQPGHAAKS